MVDGMGRRRLLASAATAFVGTASGCSAVGDWTEERARKRRRRIPRLCRTVELGNYDSEPHVFHVLVERDGEIMRWWRSDEIPDHRIVEVELGSWHWERGHYVIYGSYDDYPDWAMNDLSDRELAEDEACIWPRVSIGEAGHVTVTTTHQGKNEYSTPTSTDDS
jgi:hypothetical protein